LARRGLRARVFEADASVGGLAKTLEFGGYRFDLGGHRFFTKLKPIERLWHEMLGDEFLLRPRLSRIYYGGKYFAYPLQARDVASRIGVGEAILCTLSYLWSRLVPRPAPATFEDWVTKHFGHRLYDTFFRSYTEKVWGLPGSEIRAEWAVQRIKDFSLFKAILSALHLQRAHITTLIEEFHYPRLGPGQMWQEFQRAVETEGTTVSLNHRCIAVRHDGHGTVESVLVENDGVELEVAVDAVLSSIPLRELVLALDPAPPPAVIDAARKLRYRSLCVVALIVEDSPFPDNWIYLHDPGTRAARVQNYGAWSAAMVRPGTTCLGVEYFCFDGDEIWLMSDVTAVELATAELARIGLVEPERVVDGVKVRVPRAYPIYDRNYKEALSVIRSYVESFTNLQTFGRNGLHRYNNQDHSMWTATLATLNLVEGAQHDVWSVNTEPEYLEEFAIDGAVPALDVVG
jgi:protoporphyrinogen oxidase